MNIEEYALRCDDADDEPSECKVCANNGNDYCFACDNGNQFKPMTNADRIRAMTDEELAEWLASFCSCGDIEDICPAIHHNGCGSTDCVVPWLDWLKQEVDNG